MTGEMSRNEVTRETFPLYFACVDALGHDGATVEPFDVYQGPYINVPGVGRIFACEDTDRGYFWFNDCARTKSGEWLGEWSDDNDEAISSFCALVENGGDAA